MTRVTADFRVGGQLRRNRGFGGCRHEATVVTITAGIAHEVCETCGQVSIRFVASAVGNEPVAPRKYGEDTVVRDVVAGRRCKLCSQQAVFIIPDGLMCDEHAWQAAARLRWDESEPWVPIRIDRARA